MKLGVDMDDTVAFSNRKLIETALLFDEKYVNGRGFKNRDGKTLLDKFYWNIYHVEQFLNVLPKGDYFLSLDVKEEANKYIAKLCDEGHKVFFITRRNKSFLLKMKTRKWLKKNGFKYNGIVFGITNKGEYCKAKGIDLLIDNDRRNIDSALGNGVDAILMEDDYNKDLVGYNRLRNWKEIYDYISGVK